MKKFRLVSKFRPTGDQPAAITQLVKNLKAGEKHQVLLGVTGSGKTFTMAKVIEKTQRPTLIISHNKTLAAQLYQEFKDFFPENSVHYFVSYFDYYQPEAYLPQTDTYIEKDSKINEELDRLRHAAVQDLLTRKDVIVIASVSCIYNIGSPKDYKQVSLEIKPGQKINRHDFLADLTALQYQRNDIEQKPGIFRVRGNYVDIYLITGEKILRVEFLGDEISRIYANKDSRMFANKFEPTGGARLFPGHFWITPQDKLKIAIENIKLELQERLKELKGQKKIVEVQRLEQKVNYDMEMLKETGFCYGIENYSRHLEFRKPGQSPYTLIDYFLYPVKFAESKIFNRARDFLIFIDESHQTLPQLHAMSNQDKARKKSLIDYGFRLPSAIDNRPLIFREFEERENQVIYVSATPSEEELQKAQPRRPKKSRLRSRRQGRLSDRTSEPQTSENIIEQIIRPTGLTEPTIEIRPTENQVKDLIKEIKLYIAKKQRILALTLTKRLAEALSEYLSDEGISSQWLHSEVKTLERPKILKEFREGKYDVLVGINLLREGLDLPEVALVAILDADKEGFLRSQSTLIQTMGRAARHTQGRVILYADKITGSMKAAISEINRRRKIQEKYNKKYHIIPKTIQKDIKDWPFIKKEKEIALEFMTIGDKKLLKREMREAAHNLDFERAAEIRDLISKLKK
ncbi:MAG: excinuclease ABC subunit UvrB [Patescibacteria group bacterium]